MDVTYQEKCKKISQFNQQELKNYLCTFYEKIYQIRFYIQLHSEIVRVSNENLRCSQFWGCMQQNLLVQSIISSLFAIFDDNKKHILKKFVRFLKSMLIYTISDKDIERWINILQPHESFRNKIIAHTDICKPHVLDVNYIEFQKLLNEFEKKLHDIQKNFILDKNLINDTWSCSSIDLNAQTFTDIRELLVYSSRSGNCLNVS